MRFLLVVLVLVGCGSDPEVVVPVEDAGVLEPGTSDVSSVPGPDVADSPDAEADSATPDGVDPPDTGGPADADDPPDAGEPTDTADTADTNDPPDVPPLTANPGPWSIAERTFARTPHGHVAGVVCHNCYEDDAADIAGNLAGTLAQLHAAIQGEADILELDVAVVDGDLRVTHDDNQNQAAVPLVQVLADPAIVAANQLLYIEIKSLVMSTDALSALLDALATDGLARHGRPVVLRVFQARREHLLAAQALLADQSWAEIAPHVRFHEIFHQANAVDPAGWQALFDETAASGFDGVEVRHTAHNLHSGLRYAQSLGLTTGVWTLPKSHGSAHIAAWRSATDSLVTDYPVAAARAVVEEDNALVYFNTWDQFNTWDPLDSSSLSLFRADDTVHSVSLAGGPTLVQQPAGQGLFGGALTFDGTAGLDLGPVVRIAPRTGFLASVVVSFDDPSAAGVQQILGNSDQAGFYLDLKDGVLRFGMRTGVDGYTTATRAASDLIAGESYLITGAWDGDGGVRLWVNGSDDDVVVASATGSMIPSASPLLVGADPQGIAESRYYLSGRIQHAQVLRWAPHDCLTQSECVNEVVVVVGTSTNGEFAGTNDLMQVCLGDWCFPLDNGEVNDNEWGQVDHHIRPVHGPLSFDTVRLLPAAGQGGDAWRPGCLAVVADGELLYCYDQIQPLLVGSDPGDAPEFTDVGNTLSCGSCYGSRITHGPMIGDSGPGRMTVWLRAGSGVSVAVRWSTDPALANPTVGPALQTRQADDFVTRVAAEGLPVDTLIYYQIEIDGTPEGPIHSTRSAPAAQGQTTAVYGSCMKYSFDATYPVFDAVQAEDPDLLLLLGDNHYANTTDPDRLAYFYLQSRASPGFASVLSSAQTATTWDDHDYTGNNTDGSVASKMWARVAFERYWANADYADDASAGVWHSFVRGDVEYFLIDDRWYRDSAA
ncbi:MAG: glycerophosphoryl diester phosphodiesterase, partial [Myxococcota bacterium]